MRLSSTAGFRHSTSIVYRFLFLVSAFLLAFSVQACSFLLESLTKLLERIVHIALCAFRSLSASQSADAYITGMRSIRVQRERSDTMGKLRLYPECEI